MFFLCFGRVCTARSECLRASASKCKQVQASASKCKCKHATVRGVTASTDRRTSSSVTRSSAPLLVGPAYANPYVVTVSRSKSGLCLLPYSRSYFRLCFDPLNAGCDDVSGFGTSEPVSFTTHALNTCTGDREKTDCKQLFWSTRVRHVERRITAPCAVCGAPCAVCGAPCAVCGAPCAVCGAPCTVHETTESRRMAAAAVAACRGGCARDAADPRGEIAQPSTTDYDD